MPMNICSMFVLFEIFCIFVCIDQCLPVNMFVLFFSEYMFNVCIVCMCTYILYITNVYMQTCRVYFLSANITSVDKLPKNN